MNPPDHPNDSYDLKRFLKAQEKIYSIVLEELRSGMKRSHWMWFIFPQINGLGFSPTSQFYAIKSEEEAWQYLRHPVLGSRLVECAETVLAVQGRTVSEIFGYPDDLKLKSSMTLFETAAEQPGVFARVLEKYFQGERDGRTLQILEGMKGKH